jgi:hypothetical protein
MAMDVSSGVRLRGMVDSSVLRGRGATTGAPIVPATRVGSVCPGTAERVGIVWRRRGREASVALVRKDLMQRAWRSGGSSRSPFRGRFARPGTLRLTTTAYHQSAAAQRVRVKYSPASRIVWSLEPPRSPVGM